VAAGFARIFCGVMGEKGRRKRGKFCMCLIFMWEVSQAEFDYKGSTSPPYIISLFYFFATKCKNAKMQKYKNAVF